MCQFTYVINLFEIKHWNNFADKILMIFEKLKRKCNNYRTWKLYRNKIKNEHLAKFLTSLTFRSVVSVCLFCTFMEIVLMINRTYRFKCNTRFVARANFSVQIGICNRTACSMLMISSLTFFACRTIPVSCFLVS